MSIEERLERLEERNRQLSAEMARLLTIVQEKLRERDLLLAQIEDTLVRKIFE